MTSTLRVATRRPDTERSQHRVLALLAVATAVGSIGLGAGGTAGVLLAVDMAGTHTVAGLPVALHLAGSAVGALLVSHQAGRGRRGRGLALGFTVGAVGAAVVTVAAEIGSLTGMLAGSTLLGMANSSIFLTRYAAVEAGSERTRGRALGAVFLATAIGAVISPMLLGPSGTLAERLGLPPLTGLYLVAMGAFGCSALAYAAASDPRTPWLGAGARVLSSGRRQRLSRPDLLRALRDGPTRVALLSMAATSFVMTGVMTIAPVRLTEHGHGLEMVGALVALHVVGMFAPAPLNGYLADRVGGLPVVLLGGVLMLVMAVMGVFLPGHATGQMVFHLVVVGLAWNCGVVGSSMLLTEAVSPSLRPYTEGIGEATMGTAAMLVAPLVGALPGTSGYYVLALCAAGVTLLALVHLRRPARDPRSLA